MAKRCHLVFISFVRSHAGALSSASQNWQNFYHRHRSCRCLFFSGLYLSVRQLPWCRSGVRTAILFPLGFLELQGKFPWAVFHLQYLKNFASLLFTRLSFFLLLLLEVICYVGTFWGICNGFLPFVGYIVPFVLSLGIILTFSLHSDSRVFSKPAFRYLGIFSLVLYLNHRYWCVFLNKIAPFSTKWATALRFVTYLILSIASALMCWVIVFCFRKIKQCVGPKIKTWLISS